MNIEEAKEILKNTDITYDMSNEIIEAKDVVLKELENQINTRIIEENYIDKNYISKDKIRKKIKEYDGLKEIDKQAYEEQVKPLRELLRE